MEDNTPQSDENEAFSPRPAAALRELEERARAALSAQHGQIERLENQLTRQLESITAAIANERAAEAESTKQIDESRADLERLRHEVEQARSEWQTKKEKEEQEIAALRADLEASSAHQFEQAEQLVEKGRALDARQAALDQKESDLTEREAKLLENTKDSDSSADVTLAQLERERDELQQKFELALQDVQRFRGRAAELEQELARRPEASQTDSAELVALRAERDALAERIEQLERQPVAQVEADTEQQIADLRRRFELAVEDVRELKTKNAQLEAKLAAGAPRPAASTDGGGMDWESQKRRLLASLENTGDDDDDPLPEKERITIENTIEMTDAVVAEKDREIEDLKAQLSASGSSKPDPEAEARDEQVKQLLDADEVIAEHRKRIGNLEREMEDKLRAAELEISVERAKIARQKAELEESRNELESQRQSYGPAGGAGAAAGAPRRRWLSKLGLSGEDPS
jgi:chromosome segregation ATPase